MLDIHEHQERIDVANRLSQMDIPSLREELSRSLKITADTLSYLAAIWRELENRGEDLTDLRNGVGQHLAMIAAGQLAPEVVIRFAGRPILLRAVQTLPLNEQRLIAQGSPLKVATLAKDNTIVSKDITAASLTSDQIRIAFDHGRVRSLAEQENMIESSRVAARRRSKQDRNYKIKINKDAGTANIGKMTVSLREIIDTLQVAGILTADAHQQARSLIVDDNASVFPKNKRDNEIKTERANSASLSDLADKYGLSRQRIDVIAKSR